MSRPKQLSMWPLCRLQLQANELADLLYTNTTKTLRAHRDGKKRFGPAASEQVLKLLSFWPARAPKY